MLPLHRYGKGPAVRQNLVHGDSRRLGQFFRLHTHRRLRYGHGRSAAPGVRRAPRRGEGHRGRPAGVAALARRGRRRRAARRGAGHRRLRPAARPGAAGPPGQSRTPGAARQRQAGAGRRGRSGRRARRAAVLGRGGRGGAAGRAAGGEAALAGADRAGGGPAGGRGAPAARLAGVAVAGAPGPADHRPGCRVRHRVLVGGQRFLPARPGGGSRSGTRRRCRRCSAPPTRPGRRPRGC